MKEINVKDIDKNFYKLIDENWMLVTAGSGDKFNTMTASWGHFGALWGFNTPTTIIYVRPSRYTKEFVDSNDYYSLSFFNEEYKDDLKYLGSHSGKDEDKLAKTNLHVENDDKANYFREAELVIICKKLYAQELKEECFVEKELISKNYPNKDFHTFYIGEVVKVLKK